MSFAAPGWPAIRSLFRRRESGRPPLKLRAAPFASVGIRELDEKRAADKKSADVAKMARFIAWVDQAARILIEAALVTAVEQTKTPRTKAYLKSVQAKAKDGDVLGVSRLMARRRYLETLDAAVEAEDMKQLWRQRLKQLEHVIASATAIQEDFKRRRGELFSPKTKA